MLGHEVVVDRQLLILARQASRFGPPKTRASVRTIPVPLVVVDSLAAHRAAFPPGDDGLMFRLDGRPITRQAFSRVWRPVVAEVGLVKGTGFHALRHYYASLLIRHGESAQDGPGSRTGVEQVNEPPPPRRARRGARRAWH